MTVTLSDVSGETPAQRDQLFTQGVSEIISSGSSFIDAGAATVGDDPILLSRVPAQHGEAVSGAGLPGGGYVLAWAYPGVNGTIQVQAFDADGSRAAPSTVLAEGIAPFGPFRVPGDIVVLDNGSYVVTWSRTQAYAQLFDASHHAVGSPAQISSSAALIDMHVAGSGLDDGGYVLAWSRNDNGVTTVEGQRFDAAGVAVGGEFSVSTTGPRFADYAPQVARLDNGGFVVAWMNTANGVAETLYSQVYDAGGHRVGAQTTVAASANTDALLSIDGGYAVFYRTQANASLNVYDNGGALIAAKSNLPISRPEELKAVVLSGGDLLLAWSSYDEGVRLQRFTSTGEEIGPETFVAGYSSTVSELIATNDNGYVLSYGVRNQGPLVHQVFTEYQVHSLTGGIDVVAADPGDSLLEAAFGDFGPGDSLDGGLGRDIIQLSGGLIFQLDQTAVLTGYEELRGSSSSEQIHGTAGQFAQFSTIDGHEGTDSLVLTAPGTVDLSKVVNFERFVGSSGDDRVILGPHGLPDDMIFSSEGGADTLIVDGYADLAELKVIGDWRVTAATGETATVRLTDPSQTAYVWGLDSTITVEASALTLGAEERARLFSQGVDYIVQADAVFTPGGGLSLLSPAMPTQGNAQNAAFSRISPATAALPGGGYIAVWDYDGDGAVFGDIRAQVFDAFGAKVAGPFVVNTTTADQQSSPSVAVLSDGGFVVSWMGPDAWTVGIYTQRFDAAGTRVGGETLVNTTTVGQQIYGQVTALGSGYVVSWLDNLSGFDAIRFQRFDATGTAVGSEQLARTGLEIDSKPSVAVLADGGFVLSWDERAADTFRAVHYQRFDAAGVAVGGAVRIADPMHALQKDASVAGLADGGFLVAWASTPIQDPQDTAGAYVQRYDAAGVAIGEQVLVSHGPQSATSTVVTSLADGGYVVGWSDELTRHVFVQRFDADDRKVGGQIDLDPGRSTGQFAYLTDLTAVRDGFVASWYGDNGLTKLISGLDFHTLTSGADTVSASSSDGWVVAAAGDLNGGDNLAGGTGVDTLEHLGPGRLDLTSPTTFNGFERLLGSTGDDEWLVSASRLNGLSSISGGAGDDWITLAAPGLLDVSQITLTSVERINGSSGDDTFVGSGGTDHIFGLGGDDVVQVAITALDGSKDFIDGGSGVDTLSYAQTNFGVRISLLVTTQQNGAGYITITNFEHLTGSAFADQLTGDDADNVLVGLDGDDRLTGGGGADLLRGGAGADSLYGGLGDDSYVVDQQGDLVFEAAGGGTDSVTTTGDYYLYANIENLTLSSTAGAILGVGNDLANGLTGNAGANTLLGGLGDDTVNGGDGADRLFGEGGTDVLNGQGGDDYLVGGDGSDLIDGGEGADALYGQDGADMLIGGAGLDTLVGGAGNDALNGASGAGEQDLMDGGDGNDDYLVDAANDLTFEAGGGGTDTVTVSMGAGGGYYLYANVETMLLIGQTAYGVGNELANVITGNEFGNWLLGGGGNDTLNGKVGPDVLFGQGGADTFVFQRGTGGDVIGDFQAGIDKIQLTGIYTTFDQVHNSLHQNGSDTAIDLGQGDFVVVNGVAAAALTGADFVF